MRFKSFSFSYVANHFIHSIHFPFSVLHSHFQILICFIFIKYFFFVNCFFVSSCVCVHTQSRIISVYFVVVVHRMPFVAVVLLLLYFNSEERFFHKNPSDCFKIKTNLQQWNTVKAIQITAARKTKSTRSTFCNSFACLFFFSSLVCCFVLF